MASLARTKYVMTMDDDFTLSDAHVLRDLVAFAEKERNEHQIIGFTGTIFHPNVNETYQNGFHCSANKFGWSTASQLKWQEGIVYETTEEKKETEQQKEQWGGSKGRGYQSKPWHSTPRWVWEKIKPEKEEMKKIASGRGRGTSGGGKSSSSRSSSSGSRGSSSNAQNMTPSTGQKRKSTTSGSSSSSNNNTSNTSRGADEGHATSVKVDIIKGRMMFLQATSLRQVPFAFNVNDIRGDDIAISGLVGQGLLGQHRVVRLLSQRILELPAPFALCATAGADHYSRRDAVRRRFFPSHQNVGGRPETTAATDDEHGQNQRNKKSKLSNQ